MPMEAKAKKTWLAAVSIAVSGGILTWLLWRLDWPRTIELICSLDRRWLLAALGIACGLPLLATARWMGVLHALDTPPLPYGEALRAVMTANALNSFLPSKAGDLAKAAFLRRRAGLPASLGTVALERLVDLGVLGALGLAGSLAAGVAWGLASSGFLLVNVLAVFLVICLIPKKANLPLPDRLTQAARDASRVFHLWLAHRGAIAQTLLASLLHWALAGLIVCALLSAVGGGVPWPYAFGIFPMAILAGLIPTTISGYGTRDAAFVALLSAFLPREEATLVALGYMLVSYWFLSLLGLPFAATALRHLNRGTK
jgi:glycosyltransferase 2 family protein